MVRYLMVAGLMLTGALTVQAQRATGAGTRAAAKIPYTVRSISYRPFNPGHLLSSDGPFTRDVPLPPLRSPFDGFRPWFPPPFNPDSAYPSDPYYGAGPVLFLVEVEATDDSLLLSKSYQSQLTLTVTHISNNMPEQRQAVRIEAGLALDLSHPGPEWIPSPMRRSYFPFVVYLRGYSCLDDGFRIKASIAAQPGGVPLSQRTISYPIALVGYNCAG